ncbi:MAG TPA: phospholipid carrier-dependent glycosyltransferase [Dokdonella sp.]|nr:phospholipid carrier-dependent glycosyltransferase [Dokdonella sp.]
MRASSLPAQARTYRPLSVLAVVLLAAFAVLRSWYGTRLDSFTIDEPWHIVAGTSYERGGDMHLNPEHPPLAKRWVGAWMPADFRLPAEPALKEKEQEREWVEKAMFLDNDFVRIQGRARLAMWVLNGLLLAAFGMLLLRATNAAWAAGTLGFLALEPTLGAHLPVVMTDGPLALTLALAVVAAGLLAATWQWRWVLVFGITVGLALGAKHSALAGLLGVGLVLIAAAFARRRDGGWREAAWRGVKLVAGVALGVALLWAQYGFRFHADRDGGDRFNRPIDDKIADVSTASLRAALEVADRYHMLPRAYLWGLADTVRTGVEGRGGGTHLVWGRLYEGRTPWFTWPAIIAAKVPLALSALALLGLVLLVRTPLPATARWMLAALAAASAIHLAALMASPEAWGGIRHATPLIVAAAMLGGCAVAAAWQRRSPVLTGAVAAAFVVALATTVREPRLWEYHNELVGGTAEAYRYFENEGLDLGQRYGEVIDFYRREIAPGGLPLYSGHWVMSLMEGQWRGARVDMRRRVESLDDDNVAGLYQGWFVQSVYDEVPRPDRDWNPAQAFEGMQRVARFGYVTIWRGRQANPAARAASMTDKVMNYIYKQDGSDWQRVARCLEQVVALRPQAVDAGVELGNAYLRLGDAAKAARAYRRLLEQDKAPLDAKVARQLRGQLARIEGGEDPSAIAPLRNPWME